MIQPHRFHRAVPTPHAADWRRLVTICIAAIAGNGKDLVLASDSRVSFGTYSADRAVNKNVPFIGEYALLFAGNDVAHAGMVISRAQKKAQKVNMTDPNELAEVVFQECQAERDRIGEAQVLKKHLLSLDTFQKQGKSLCTDAVFYDIHSQLEQVSVVLPSNLDSQGLVF